MNFPDVYLMRHGQTEWNVAARLQGRLDSPLTSQGRAQAAQQGALLKPVWKGLTNPTAFCSPLGRTQHTAQIVFDGIDAQLRTDPRLREVSGGSWDGAFLSDIEKDSAPIFEQARNGFELMFLAPDGEGQEAVFERCRSFLADLTGPSILVTHGVTMGVLRGLLRGMQFEDVIDMGQEQGCIYAIKNGVETILR